MHAASCTCARLVLEGAQDVEQHPPRRWQRQGGQQPHAVVARSQGGNLRGSLRVAGCQQRGGQGGSSSGLEDGVLQRACAARWVALGAAGLEAGASRWAWLAPAGAAAPAPPHLDCVSLGARPPWGGSVQPIRGEHLATIPWCPASPRTCAAFCLARAATRCALTPRAGRAGRAARPNTLARRGVAERAAMVPAGRARGGGSARRDGCRLQQAGGGEGAQPTRSAPHPVPRNVLLWVL